MNSNFRNFQQKEIESIESDDFSKVLSLSIAINRTKPWTIYSRLGDQMELGLTCFESYRKVAIVQDQFLHTIKKGNWKL